MITKIIEAHGNGLNWGKFMLARYDTEWQRSSAVVEGSNKLLRSIGWSEKHIWILDLQTGEGACFLPGGLVSYDLDKRKIWVCPLYQPFMEWVYKQDLSDITKLPDVIELPDAPAAIFGYRRPGIARV